MKYEDYDWKELSKAAKDAAKLLGYTRKMWNNDKEPDVTDLDWNELNPKQQKAAITLGYSKEIWDSSSSSSSDSSSSSSSVEVVRYDKYDWKDLPNAAKDAAKFLGYTPHMWNNDTEPDVTELDWDEMNPRQQEAAMTLGYSKEIWEAPEEPPNLICLQIYTETEDYLLVDKEDVGVCMLANREMKGDERFFQSPTGPEGQEKYLCRPSQIMTKERQSFAERFMEWQSTYGQNAPTVGASECDRRNFTLADFEGRDDDDDHDALSFSPEHTKDEESKNYCYFFEMLPRHCVLVELIAGPNSNVTLPPERQFEVLPYDEAIRWCGEDDYDAAKHKRPPKLCSAERDLEVPGHFSNHACGASATVYDNYRLSNDGVLVAPAQSPERQAQLRAWMEGKDEDDDREPSWEEEHNVLTTYKAMHVGSEVLTDYVLWHWCNVDYDWGDEPWFHCICGDIRCHSASGFHGLKCFPLEEQKRLYWVCSEWIQNQIDWKLYQLQQGKN